jgi:hypothetical protein
LGEVHLKSETHTERSMQMTFHIFKHKIHASGSGLTTVIEPCEIVDQTKIITISSNSRVQAPYRTYTMTYHKTKFQDLTHNQYHMPVSTSMDYEMTYMVKLLCPLWSINFILEIVSQQVCLFSEVSLMDKTCFEVKLMI